MSSCLRKSGVFAGLIAISLLIWLPAGASADTHRFVTSWVGSAHSQTGMDVDRQGNIYVTRTDGIYRYTADGDLLRKVIGDALFPNGPESIAVDDAGRIYGIEYETSQISVFEPDGSLIAQFGSFGSGPGQLRSPRAIATGPNGTFYVTDDIKLSV